MKNKLEEIRKNSLIELDTWAGLSITPGLDTTIVTKDYKVYYYHNYHHVPSYLKDKLELESLSEGKELSKEIIKELNEYIEELFNKEYQTRLMKDATFKITINYDNKNLIVNNYPELNSSISKIIRGGK